jgi:LPXTG-motif cell wall-anchored protein
MAVVMATCLGPVATMALAQESPPTSPSTTSTSLAATSTSISPGTTLGGPLPRTGADLLPLILWGLVLIALGILFVLRARRQMTELAAQIRDLRQHAQALRMQPAMVPGASGARLRYGPYRIPR